MPRIDVEGWGLPPTTHKTLTVPAPGEPAADPGAEASSSERRAHERIQVLLEVDYRADETFLFAYITDISVMGIFVQTDAPETPGSQLKLRFTPPGDEEPIECEGEVVWINPPREGTDDDRDGRSPGMGIQFRDLTLEQRERIMNLVRTIAYLDHVKSDNCQ